jgi:molecular chaperone DnaK (HSP70)
VAGKVVCFDLGTTNGCVAIMENRKTRVIENELVRPAQQGANGNEDVIDARFGAVDDIPPG